MVIYGHPKQGQKKFINSAVYDKGGRQSANIRDPVEHAQQRRFLSNAFSTRALREQEIVIHRYLDLLVQRPSKLGGGGDKPVDVSAAYIWLTSEVIGQLTPASVVFHFSSGYWPRLSR